MIGGWLFLSTGCVCAYLVLLSCSCSTSGTALFTTVLTWYVLCWTQTLDELALLHSNNSLTSSFHPCSSFLISNLLVGILVHVACEPKLTHAGCACCHCCAESLDNHSLAIDIVHVCSNLDDPVCICVSWFSSKFF